MENEDEKFSLSETSLSRRSSSEPNEFFEFFHGDQNVMSSAEDIIFRGRLVPFKELRRAPTPPPERVLRRRSESLSALHGGSDRTAVMRASRSLDYQRLSTAERLASPKKLKWPALLMFGAMKLPTEMELGDIKSRQARKRSLAGNGRGREARGASWRLLKALSCKDHASVTVTASLCMPQV